MSKDWLSTCLVLVMALLGLAFFLFSTEDPVLAEPKSPDYSFNSECSLNTNDCLLHLAESLDINFRISPEEIRALERFDLKVSVSGQASEKVSGLIAWLEGRDMDMGTHFLSLSESTFEAQKPLIFSGVIPVCSIDDDMVWRLVVSFVYGGQVMQVNFELQTQPHGA